MFLIKQNYSIQMKSEELLVLLFFLSSFFCFFFWNMTNTLTHDFSPQPRATVRFPQSLGSRFRCGQSVGVRRRRRPPRTDHPKGGRGGGRGERGSASVKTCVEITFHDSAFRPSTQMLSILLPAPSMLAVDWSRVRACGTRPSPSVIVSFEISVFGWISI